MRPLKGASDFLTFIFTYCYVCVSRSVERKNSEQSRGKRVLHQRWQFWAQSFPENRGSSTQNRRNLVWFSWIVLVANDCSSNRTVFPTKQFLRRGVK